jgi:riboflavin kinase/FMN adenylyltransferase
MFIHHQLSAPKVLSPTALAVGTFDGVHRGHLELIKTLRETAAQNNLQSAVLTFVDMPFCYFFPNKCPRLLTLAEEKITQFAATGIDHLWIVPFNQAIASQEYDAFVKSTLVEKLGMRSLVAGPDFALGKGRRGDLSALRELGKSLHYDVKVLSQKYFYKDAPVSSTRTRAAFEEGSLQDGNVMLGRNYRFSGKVISGRGWGKRLGMPTINVAFPARKVLPAPGVYAARARLDEATEWLPAALSIGDNSSVGGNEISVEFHVIGKSILTPKIAQVEMVSWHRAQQHFENLDSLAAQMQRDVETIAAILSANFK